MSISKNVENLHQDPKELDPNIFRSRVVIGQYPLTAYGFILIAKAEIPDLALKNPIEKILKVYDSQIDSFDKAKFTMEREMILEGMLEQLD
jgi:hypothetical protein